MSHTLDEIIDALPITYSAVFVPQSQSRNADERDRSINWKITIERNGNVLTTDYMQGIGHIPNYQKIGGFIPRKTVSLEQFEKLASEQRLAARSLESRGGEKLPAPLLKDVLYSLILDSSVLDHPSLESWAGDFGYDVDSRKAEQIYKDCLSIALQLRSILGADKIAELQTAYQDY